ncbi:MAG: linear amide C-N hydrolase [Deltaproteobacteria bacterium]|nr:linear amide C-N hydrolase [Deltaproteobacteria bacterium]
MKKLTVLLILCAVLNLVATPDAAACTRVVYQGPENTVITARSMDWKDEIPANMWIFPRGLARQGEVGPNSVAWKSRYGSVVVSSFNNSAADGMNEKGLAANMLWLAESEYPKYDGKQKGLTIAAWAQYALDNFASVKEAVDELGKEKFVIVSDFLPGSDKYATLHLSISDATGDNAIFEYIGGKLTIHHDRSYTVMTNSPVFSKQLALNEYWASIPGTVMLPGTNRAADRFVRASYYIKTIRQTSDVRIAVAGAFSVIRNCSVPFGISTKNEPNISSTRWRSVSDQKNLTYYFENVLTPNVFWVDFKKVDFSEKAPVRKLALEKYETYAGDAAGAFKNADPFKFQGLNFK